MTRLRGKFVGKAAFEVQPGVGLYLTITSASSEHVEAFLAAVRTVRFLEGKQDVPPA